MENHHLNKKVILCGLTESKPECCENLEADVIDQLLYTVLIYEKEKLGENGKN